MALVLGTAATQDSSAFASAAQGAEADSAVQEIVAGTGVIVDAANPQHPIVSFTGVGTGSVTNVSVAAANGFLATVATPTTTPVITMKTSVTGILKGTGTALTGAAPADFPTLNQNTTGYSGSTAGVVSIADLRLITGSVDGEIITLAGYYAEADGGGGQFVWNAASTTADNGGTIIAPTGVPIGRWYRLYTYPVSVKWFGAKGDNSTDDSTAIQNAMTFAKTGSLYFPAGVYVVKTTLVLDSPYIKIVGDGMFETEIYWQASSAGTLFSFTTGNYVQMEDISLNAYTGTGNYFRTGDIAIDTYAVLTLNRCYLVGFQYLVKWEGGYYHKFSNCRFEKSDICFYNWNANNVTFTGCRWLNINRAFQSNGGAGPVSFLGCAFETWCSVLIGGASGDYPAVSIIGCYFENYPTTAAGNGLATAYYSAGEIASVVGEFTFIGNIVSTNGIQRILDNGGVNTSSIVSLGNRIICDLTASSSWMDYAFIFANLETGILNDTLDSTLVSEGSPTFTFAYVPGGSSIANYNLVQVYNPLTGLRVIAPWTAASFLNGWGNNGTSSYDTAAYRYVDNKVQLKGVVTGAGATGAPIFNLPAGYRPTKYVWFTVGNGFGATPSLISMRIDTNGDVRCENGTYSALTTLSLDGVSFPIDN